MKMERKNKKKNKRLS